jgi:DNA-binding transcriptional LysR family regulator
MSSSNGQKVSTLELVKQRSFVQTVRTGGIASAARALGLTPSAVSKNISRLEAELGVQLLARDNRRVVPTERGLRAYEAYGALLAELDRLQATLAAPATLTGQLALSVPGGTLAWLAPLLRAYRARHPQVQLRLNVSDAHTDMVRDRNDLAIRFGQLKDSRTRALPLGSTPLLVCAAPAYLARAGTPGGPAELGAHEGLLFRLPESGKTRPVQLSEAAPAWRCCAVIDDGQALVQAALAGFGLAQLPALLVQEHLEQGRLVEVLAAWRPQPLAVNLLYPDAPWLPAELEAFLEEARRHFGQARAQAASAIPSR